MLKLIEKVAENNGTRVAPYGGAIATAMPTISEDLFRMRVYAERRSMRILIREMETIILRS